MIIPIIGFRRDCEKKELEHSISLFACDSFSFVCLYLPNPLLFNVFCMCCLFNLETSGMYF